MKYSVLFGLAALALGFTACDDIEDSNSLPQSNPQLDIVSASNVSLSQGPAAASLIDLQAANDADASIAIATVSAASDWPEGFEATVPYMQFSPTEDFAKFATIATTMGGEGTVLVAPDTWEENYTELIGKSPKAKTLYVRFPVVAVNGDQKIRMGGENYFYGNFGVNVKPFDLFDGQIIEDNYYLITNVGNWNVAQAIPFIHSDADVYDDPVFSLPFDVSGAGFEWAVIPATTFAAGSLGTAYGVEIAEEADGVLTEVAAGQAITYGLINETGPHMLTINMLDLTYNVKMAYEKLYTPGNSNGWDFGGAQVLTTTDYINYYGYAHLNGIFKFTTQPDWGGVNLGEAGEGKLSTDGGAANLNAPEDALYWAHVNLPALTYDLYMVSTIGLIGDATPGGWDNDTALTPSADFLTWSATVEMKGDGKFKFRANNAWAVNLGGSLDDLTQGEADIATPGAGTYVVTLNLSAVPYTATFTKQ